LAIARPVDRAKRSKTERRRSSAKKCPRFERPQKSRGERRGAAIASILRLDSGGQIPKVLVASAEATKSIAVKDLAQLTRSVQEMGKMARKQLDGLTNSVQMFLESFAKERHSQLFGAVKTAISSPTIGKPERQRPVANSLRQQDTDRYRSAREPVSCW
jgi:hypothetical protein